MLVLSSMNAKSRPGKRRRKKGGFARYIPQPTALIGGLFLVVVLLAGGHQAFIYLANNPQNLLAAVSASDVVFFTNEERTRGGVSALVEDERLDRAAAAKAADMVGRGYFAHVGPGGQQPWEWITTEGYAYQFAGENLAVRFQESQDVVDAWMASPSHRANVLKTQYTNIGVGVAHGLFEGKPATYIVQYFGTPASSTNAAPSVSPPARIFSNQGAAVQSGMVGDGTIDAQAASI